MTRAWAGSRHGADDEGRHAGGMDEVRRITDSLVALAQLRDGFSASDSRLVVALAREIGRRSGLDPRALGDLELAAELRDIGTVGVPDRILHKPGRLDENEWAAMRRHAVLGADVLARVPPLARVAEIVRHHHEHWSGNGYPDGLREQEIPVAARIVAVCEAFGALISDRPYRPAHDRATALSVITAAAGDQFDPSIVTTLLEALPDVAATAAPSARRFARTADRRPARRPSRPRLSDAFDALEALPALVESHERLRRLAEQASSSREETARVVEADVALTISVLRSANHGRRRSKAIGDVPRALRCLPDGAIQDIAARLGSVGAFQRVPGWQITVEQFRLHAVATQRATEQIAMALDRRDFDELMTAALLHDVGKLVLAHAYPGYPSGVTGDAATPEERLLAERRELGVDHGVVGGVMARRWNLPSALQHVIEHHHDADPDGDAAVVRLADMFAHHWRGATIDRPALAGSGDALGLSASELRSLMHDIAPATQRRATGPSPLSSKETAVLSGLAQGKVYKDIAEELGLSISTIRTHCHTIYTKLDVHDRAQAVLTASANGWLTGGARPRDR